MASNESPNGAALGVDESYSSLMIVVAHPDDAEFSSAGTLARFVEAGFDVTIVVCTSGDKGTDRRDITSRELARIREEEQLESARRLGVQNTELLRGRDGELTPDLDLRGKIVRMIRKHRPDIVITHDPFRPYALHPDHRAVGTATVDAVYPTARDPLYFPEHLEEGFEPFKVAELWLYGSDAPDKFVDISPTIDKKIDALKAHKSQVGTAETLGERIRDRARERGKDHGVEMAEAFKVIRLRR
ncbi:PIG-L family deacetylase [soil metagenome]